MSAKILSNLMTEAQLQDVYLSMNLDGEAALSVDEAEAIADILEEATESVAAGGALVLTTPLVPEATLGKRKERSAQTSNEKTRELRDAK